MNLLLKVKMSHRGVLRHYTKKNKIIVTEGTSGINFSYIIDPLHLKCQCSENKYLPGKSICYHLEYYLCKVMGIKQQYLPVLSIPRVRSRINDGIVEELNTFCLKFLTDDEEDQCIICHLSYLPADANAKASKLELYQCPTCFELIHYKCHNKWSKTGGGCPRCKYKRDINGGKYEDSDWPCLPDI